MSNNLSKEGFWKSSYEPDLPFPTSNDTQWEGQTPFVRQLEQVEQVAHCEAYRGSSTCRICGCLNGHRQYTHKGWTWPEGLLHYITEHNVQPSFEFQKMINKEK